MRSRTRLPRPLLDEYEWQDRGRCRSLPVDAFFDVEEGTVRERAARADRAKAVCRGCPVWVQCLNHALAAEDFGVWGGTTGAERQALRAVAAAAAS